MSEATKKLINSVPRCVEDCLEGLVAVNPGLQILQGHRVIVRSDIEEVKKAGKVTLLSGGGSGHEPAHAGYVGSGMLSAAVCGSVFASPPPGAVLAGTKAVGLDNPAGTIMIIKNYTGDRLNFGIAAERAKAEGLKVEMVVVAEDCALTSADKTAGRRGLAGTVFIHKIVGALADEGKSIDEIANTARKAASNMGTIGMSLSPCSIPGSGPSFTLGAEEMELGLGIHGEAGVRRMAVRPAKMAVAAMLDHMTNPESSTHLSLKSGDKVALMVNNLGGTSVLELNIVAREAIQRLEIQGITVERAYCGSFMTALEMAGVSLTVLHLDDTIRRCLDAPTSAPGWATPYLPKGSSKRTTPREMLCVAEKAKVHSALTGAQVSAGSSAMLHKALSYVCEALSNCEQQLNTLDRQSGDGDCGSTHKKGADAIQCALPSLPMTHPHSLLLAIAAIVEEDMGGSSGALYSLFLTAAAVPLLSDVSPVGWVAAFKAGIDAMARYGGAEPGDRTMLDPLHAAYTCLSEKLLPNADPMMAFQAAAQAAQTSAEETAKMDAHAGRASYVSREHLTQPDPGAHAVGIWMRAAYEACKLAMGK